MPRDDLSRCGRTQQRGEIAAALETKPASDALALPQHYAALMRAPGFSLNFNLKERPRRISIWLHIVTLFAAVSGGDHVEASSRCGGSFGRCRLFNRLCPTAFRRARSRWRPAFRA